MDLYEYISAYRTNPNPAVAKSLGADERLVEYLKETPWNTSVNVVRGMCGSDGPSGPYTFHFTRQEVTVEGLADTVLVCNETNKWLSYFNSLQSGTIVKATLSNIIDSSDEPVTDVPDHTYQIMKYKDNESFSTYSGMIIWQWYMRNISGYYSLPIMYAPNYISNYIMVDRSFKQIDITLEIQPGYKITIDISSDPYEGEYVDYTYNAVELGDSLEIPGGAYTDGTNIYTEGDIITPTSDMTLYPYTATVTFYDENHNLMQNLSRLRTQESYYSCSNPMQARPGDNIQLPNGLETQPLDGTWYDDNNNQYQPGDYVLISSDMNFTFIQNTTQQEPEGS